LLLLLLEQQQPINESSDTEGEGKAGNAHQLMHRLRLYIHLAEQLCSRQKAN
jgi:hypothetical protein